jgi:hypothetical protein
LWAGEYSNIIAKAYKDTLRKYVVFKEAIEECAYNWEETKDSEIHQYGKYKKKSS